MGYDQHQQSNSSGTMAAAIGVGLVLAILAIITMAGVGVFWVRAARTESQVATVEQQLVAEIQRSDVIDRLRRPQLHVADDPDPRLNFVLELDREGNTSVDGEKIDLDELRAKLAKLKDETSNVFRMHINADPDCPVKRVVPLVDVCEEVGDIDYRIVSSEGSVVRVTATVASYELAAEWDHFDDGTFSAYDVITLKVVTPERHAGAMLSITVPPTELPEDSVFRTTGTRFTFMMRESYIGATGLAWGAIDDPTIEQ